MLFRSTIAELRKMIVTLEAELIAVKVTRDQAQAENTELKRTVALLKRKLDKLQK